MPFDQAKADRAAAFLQALKHGGNWRGVNFELLGWQHKLVKDVFGTVKDDGYRQYNTSYLEIPKKNGKTELAAGIGLYLTCGDGEQGAEVYGVATDRAQASIAFDVAVEMVEQCPALKKRIKLTLSQKHMQYIPTRSIYKVLSGETKGKHGYKVHGVIFDELHEQTNRELYDVLTFGSGASRMQPLYFLITTAGDDPDRKSIAWNVHQKALRLMENPDVDPTFYSTIYGIGEDDNPADERLWHQANPSLGETITVEAVRREWTQVQSDPELERKFRQLRLNQWVKDKAANKWMSLPEWDATAGMTPRREDLKGQTCFAGLDLSTTTDLTALVLVFPPTATREKYAILPFFWIPEENMKERVKRDQVPYDKWRKQGFIMATPGDVVDYDYIEATVEELAAEFHIQELGYDPYKAMQTAIHLEAKGVTMVKTQQGWKTQDPAMTQIEVMVKKQMFQHGGHPVLRWNMGNAESQKDAKHNQQLVKGRATDRVDGVAALINAMACMMVHAAPQGSAESVTIEVDGKVLKAW